MAIDNKEYLWKDKKRTIFGLPLSFTTYAFDKERFYIKEAFSLSEGMRSDSTGSWIFPSARLLDRGSSESEAFSVKAPISP